MVVCTAWPTWQHTAFTVFVNMICHLNKKRWMHAVCGSECGNSFVLPPPPLAWASHTRAPVQQGTSQLEAGGQEPSIFHLCTHPRPGCHAPQPPPPLYWSAESEAIPTVQPAPRTLSPHPSNSDTQAAPLLLLNSQGHSGSCHAIKFDGLIRQVSRPKPSRQARTSNTPKAKQRRRERKKK